MKHTGRTAETLLNFRQKPSAQIDIRRAVQVATEWREDVVPSPIGIIAGSSIGSVSCTESLALGQVRELGFTLGAA